MGTVYLIKNNINGKCYVGVTTQSLEQRRKEHIYRSNLNQRDHKLYMAMRKYGGEHFVIVPLCSVLNDDDLPLFEMGYIEVFDSFNNGYNMTCGGNVASAETKKKISAKLKGRNITWAGKIWKARYENGTWRGHCVSGSDNPLSKRYVVEFPDGHTEDIHGLRAFCRQHNLSHNLMIAVLKGKQRHHKGFVLMTRFNDYPEREYA